MSNIICIGAHPDDVELSMGGSVLRLLDAGHEVTILDISIDDDEPNALEIFKKNFAEMIN
jgi:hypothetical protein